MITRCNSLATFSTTQTPFSQYLPWSQAFDFCKMFIFRPFLYFKQQYCSVNIQIKNIHSLFFFLFPRLYFCTTLWFIVSESLVARNSYRFSVSLIFYVMLKKVNNIFIFDRFDVDFYHSQLGASWILFFISFFPLLLLLLRNFEDSLVFICPIFAETTRC